MLAVTLAQVDLTDQMAEMLLAETSGVEPVVKDMEPQRENSEKVHQRFILAAVVEERGKAAPRPVDLEDRAEAVVVAGLTRLEQMGLQI